MADTNDAEYVERLIRNEQQWHDFDDNGMEISDEGEPDDGESRSVNGQRYRCPHNRQWCLRNVAPDLPHIGELWDEIFASEHVSSVDIDKLL